MPSKREKKESLGDRVYDLLGKHKQIVVANLMNVSSSQIQEVRLLLRKLKGELVVGKNTVIKKTILKRIEGKKGTAPMPELNKLLEIFIGKVGLIFTDASLSELKSEVEANKRPAYAKVGKLSPIDYTVPAGPTGLDPSQISFFHALQIPTKINKSQIEITKDVQLCQKGRKVSQSEAAFLTKLGHKPFAYNMEIVNAYDDGSIIGPELMNLNSAEILKRFATHANNITALSLETGIPSEGSVIQNIFTAFKNLAAISTQTGYKFKQFDANAASAPAPAKAAAPAKDDKPAAKKEEPKKDEEFEGGMGGLFD